MKLESGRKRGIHRKICGVPLYLKNTESIVLVLGCGGIDLRQAYCAK